MKAPNANRSVSQTTGIALLVVGIVLAIVALIADQIDLGGGEGFGYQQMIVMIIGIVAVLFGVRALLQPVIQDRDRRS